MRRREFLAAAAAVLAWTPRLRAAERSDPVIGYLLTASRTPDRDPVTEAYWKGLAEFGYVRDQNVKVEFRAAENDLSRLPELAQDLVRRKVMSFIFRETGVPLSAAKPPPTPIPLVSVNSGT